MTSKLDSRDRSSGDRSRTRAYLRDFLPGVVGYAVVLVPVLAWGHLDGSSPLRFVWALLPVIPALWMVRAVLRHPGRVRRLPGELFSLLKGSSVGFAVAMARRR